MKNIQYLLLTSLSALFMCAHADVVVIASSKSSVPNLDKDQIADIYLGKSNTYPDGSTAIPMALAEGDPAREVFRNAVIDKSEPQLKSYWSKMVFSGKGTPPKEIAGSAELLKLIATNPSSIGYVDKTTVDSSVKVIFAP